MATKFRIHSFGPEIIAYFFRVCEKLALFKPGHQSMKLDLVVFTVADLYKITLGILYWVFMIRQENNKSWRQNNETQGAPQWGKYGLWEIVDPGKILQLKSQNF